MASSARRWLSALSGGAPALGLKDTPQLRTWSLTTGPPPRTARLVALLPDRGHARQELTAIRQQLSRQLALAATHRASSRPLYPANGLSNAIHSYCSNVNANSWPMTSACFWPSHTQRLLGTGVFGLVRTTRRPVLGSWCDRSTR